MQPQLSRYALRNTCFGKIKLRLDEMKGSCLPTSKNDCPIKVQILLSGDLIVFYSPGASGRPVTLS